MSYIEEGVDYKSRASSDSLKRIRKSFARAKAALAATREASWESSFYQYANRVGPQRMLRPSPFPKLCGTEI